MGAELQREGGAPHVQGPESSSVGRKTAGRFSMKLGRVLMALDRTQGCSDFILCTDVQSHPSRPNRQGALSVSTHQVHSLVLGGFLKAIKHVHFLGL